MRSRWLSVDGRMEHYSIRQELQDQCWNTRPQDPQQDSDKSCDLPQKWNCDHAALLPTISDKGFQQPWCLLLQHSHGLMLTFAGSQYVLNFFLLDWIQNEHGWASQGRPRKSGVWETNYPSLCFITFGQNWWDKDAGSFLWQRSNGLWLLSKGRWLQSFINMTICLGRWWQSGPASPLRKYWSSYSNYRIMGCTHTARVSKCFGLFGRARLFSFYILPSPNFVKYEMYFPNFQRIEYFVQSFSTFSILQRVKYIKHLVRS